MSKQEPISLEQTPIELVVIINSFNRLPLLRESIASVTQALKHTPLKSAVIVFEAGSTDGSIEFIEEFAGYTQQPQIICLHPSADTDRSFSAGCNFAVEFAAKTFPHLKWCFFYETDNVIKNEFALPLAIELLKQEQNLAAIGFTVEKHDGKKAGFGSCFPTALSFVVGQQLSQKLSLELPQISKWYPFSGVLWGVCDIVFTSPLLIRYSAWQSTNGMDTVMFPYSDCDIDWCWQVYKQGWRVGVLDITGVIHDNQKQVSAWSEKRVTDFHRARLRLLLKHRGQWMTWLRLILLLRHCLEIFLLRFFSHKYKLDKKQSLEKRVTLIKTVFQGYEI
jgi:GT2 family glycosyltransferase